MTCVLAALVSAATAQSTPPNSELDLGSQAYEQAKFEEAIRHWERAVAQDSANEKAHLFLGAAYSQEYIPGAENKDNLTLGKLALEHYKRVLSLSPPQSDALTAIKGIAYLYLQMKKFDDSKDYYRKVTELTPDDAESYYSIAVIDWTQTYGPRQEERAKRGLNPEDSLPAIDKGLCLEIREKNWSKIEEAIEDLNQALQIRPDYDDAMAYMNLVYRERADVQCDEPTAYEEDLKTADEWVAKAMATKKMKEEKAQQPKP